MVHLEPGCDAVRSTTTVGRLFLALTLSLWSTAILTSASLLGATSNVVAAILGFVRSCGLIFLTVSRSLALVFLLLLWIEDWMGHEG